MMKTNLNYTSNARAEICKSCRYLKVTFDDCVLPLKSLVSDIKDYPACDLYQDLIGFMSQNGYYIAEDREMTVEFPHLRDFYKIGRYKDLQFKLACSRDEVRIIFFQGEHKKWDWDFASYLDKLEFKKIMNKLRIWLEVKGIPVKTVKFYTGADRIIQDRIVNSRYPEKEWFDLSDLDGSPAWTDDLLEPYIDRDGEELTNGCVRYFVGYDRYLHRGKCYHSTKTSWWVLEADNTATIHNTSELFTPKKDLTSARVPHKGKELLEKSRLWSA